MNLLTNKKIVSGITPSGDGSLHIGNYLGAVKQFIDIAKQNECFFFIADLHALTTIQNKTQLARNIETLILNELALLKGFLNEEEFSHIHFYRQSDVPVVTELQTILNNVTPLGFLKRAHAFKDKLQKDIAEDDINLGLFNYPILMAADILLYKPDYVPVGKDQKQHVEIARDIAERFNKMYKTTTFKLPEPYIPDDVASIVGTDGKRKMSKSLGNIISIFDEESVMKKQVMGCFTDPLRKHASDLGHIEGNTVFAYLDFFGEEKIVSEYKEAYTKGKVGDVEMKEYLFSSLMKTFTPARNAYVELKKNSKFVKKLLENGAAQARDIAQKTMGDVREAIGVHNQYSFFSYPLAVESGKITIDDFEKIEIRVGKVTEAEHVEKSEKLIRLYVDFGDFGKRIIFTGVRTFGYTKEDFSEKQFLFITNLLPRKMMGEESQGMILAVDGLELPAGLHGNVKPLFIPASGLPIGSKIR